MKDLEKHEQFEVEVLELLQTHKVLEKLIFGGGTMLRLCFSLRRYSVDLDFWFQDGRIKTAQKKAISKKISDILKRSYEITDQKEKNFTYLYEFRSAKYPRRLKIELRKEPIKNAEIERNIAFSQGSNIQVQLNTFSLGQMALNKINAFLERGEIRDAFDLEQIARMAPDIFKNIDKERMKNLEKNLKKFTKRDFRVRLGILLETKERNFYAENGFRWLETKIVQHLST